MNSDYIVGVELSPNQLFNLSLDCKKHDLLMSRKLMQQALFKSKDSNGAIKRNLLKINNEIKNKIQSKTESLKNSKDEIYLFTPHLLPTEISSHKYLYLAWIKRIFKLYPQKKIKLYITHEGGHSNHTYSKNFFDENLTNKERTSFEVVTFPSYSNDYLDFACLLSSEIMVKPYFSLFFETVETFKNNFSAKYMYDISPCLSVHCNPELPISNFVDVCFVGHEARAKNKAKFLPVIVSERRDYNDDFNIEKIDDSRKVIVTAFTNKRIIKALRSNAQLKNSLIAFLRSQNNVEWHFIGHEVLDDFFNLDHQFTDVKDKFLVYPVTQNLQEYYSQCDVYAYLPGFKGGDSGTRMAVDAGLPCVATKEKNGGFVKYATDELVCENIATFFDMLSKVISDETFSSEVVSHQQDYIKELTSESQNQKFLDYVSEAFSEYKIRQSINEFQV